MSLHTLIMELDEISKHSIGHPFCAVIDQQQLID